MPSTKPLSINRRTLLAGAAATTALAATSSAAQDTIVSAKPDMAGKSVLITGCSSGFGRLGAEHYARLGAKVFATMRGLPRPEADEIKALAKRDVLDIHVLEIDVTDDAQVTAGVAEAERINGGALDILVNNAGVGITGPVEVQDMEATKLAFDTNVLGYHRLVRAVLPGMRAKKSGQIFMISSQLGRVIVPGGGHYSATKFAVEALGEQLAYELVPHNIEVTIIQPGGYPTDVWKNRNAYNIALKTRSKDIHTSGYPEMVARMGTEDGSGRSADPMDVPNAIAEIASMPPGTRPLRRAVHPGGKPQLPINETSARVQVGWLGETPYGPWIKAVHNT